MITYNFLKYLFLYIKYYKILKKIYKDEKVPEKLSTICNCKFKIDWVGRLYCVLNPRTQNINGKFETNPIIYEYDENGNLKYDMYIERWVMQRLNFINDFIYINNLFDMLGYSITKIDDNDNYLFIIHPIIYNITKKWITRFLICFIISIILLIICLILYNHYYIIN